MFDVTILTCKAYYQPEKDTPYIQNILLEYQLIKEALEAKGLKVDRTYWDNPEYNWNKTKAVVFRTIWDYFERYEEFSIWMKKTSKKTLFINNYSLIKWNIDKHYLKDLEQKGIPIVPTYFVDKNNYKSLQEISRKQQWKDLVIKPAISGSAFHTYKIMHNEQLENEALFKNLVAQRAMLVQPFQETITTLGEASLMVFNGTYTHAILKKAKKGDYRVQDDFGGTVSPYTPTKNEITFAQHTFASCKSLPVYGRVDIIWDTKGNFYLSELEIIEPELWIRNNPTSASFFAEGIIKVLHNYFAK